MQRPTSLVFIGALLAVAGLFLNHALPELRAKWSAEERQRLLLYGANHQAICDAATELIESTKDQRSRTWTDKVWGGAPSYPHAPSCVRALHPTEITLWYGESVDINCGAQSRRYGLQVFLSSKRGSGTKQLLERLWYYDSEGQVPNP